MRGFAWSLVVAGSLALAGPLDPVASPAEAQAPDTVSCANPAATIDKGFVTGAFQSCAVDNEESFTLTMAPEDAGPINCSAWYAFRVTPKMKGQITINLDYTRCGHRYWPKTSTDGVTWDFMQDRHVEVEGERGARTARLTLKLKNKPVFVAAQEILPPSVYDAWMDQHEGKPLVERQLLGKSAEKRDIEMITLADPTGGQRETVLLIGRQHPPEVTGALAMFPFMETLMGDSDLAKAYRARFETIAVPLLNPDGVVRGHWRHNTGGVDLNRDWGPFTEPETFLMKGLMDQIDADPNRQLRLVLDFHSTNRDVFYTIPDELPTDPTLFTKKWLERYQDRMPGYEVDRDARHTIGRPISKAYSFDTYGVPAITFEIGDDTDRKLIRRIGRESAIAMMEELLETPPPAPIIDQVQAEAVTILAGGQVFDGSGAPSVVTDVAMVGDSIAHIGSDARELYPDSKLVDVTGLIVAPGFIDPHTHAVIDLASDDAGRRANLPFAFQGVTTVVTGNDGFGFPGIYEMATAAEAIGIGTNVAFLAGFGPIRETVLERENRAPTALELRRMKQMTRRAMCQGAWGFSTGLYYVPQNYARTDEVIALAREAAALGGYYDTHMRDESTYNVTVTGALAETLRIGREAGIPVHIAHIKALGPAVWGHSAQMIAMIEEARAAGQRVTADQYPWNASGTRVSNALVPRWALEGGLENLRTRLADPELRARIRQGMIESLERRGGAERLLITGRLGASSAPVGKTLADYAETRKMEPVDTALAILEEADARLASFNMSDEDIERFAYQDWVVTGSDGSTGHPRKYASFPKAYRDLVSGEGSMSLARFIQRSSGQTADIIGIPDRGYLKPGYKADIVVFDPSEFAPNATFESPREFSSGVVHLFVNGVALIRNGEASDSLPGQVLLKQTSCH